MLRLRIMIQKDGAFYMDNYFEMEAAQKSNYRRLRQLDKKQKHSIVRDSTEKSSSFSMRMIIVLLILSVTMFLKQTDVLSGNRVYASAMAEIQRQTDVEQLKEKIETTIVTPVVNQLNSRHIGENAHN